MKRFFQSVNMIITALILSLIGHAYITYRFCVDGLLFTGPNDGLEQMVPIQMFLYQKWSEGTFFMRPISDWVEIFLQIYLTTFQRISFS